MSYQRPLGGTPQVRGVPEHIDHVADVIVQTLYDTRPNEARGNTWDLQVAVRRILRSQLMSPYKVYPTFLVLVGLAGALGYFFGGR